MLFPRAVDVRAPPSRAVDARAPPSRAMDVRAPPLWATAAAPLLALGTAAPPLLALGTAAPPLLALGTAAPPLLALGTTAPPLQALGTAASPSLAHTSQLVAHLDRTFTDDPPSRTRNTTRRGSLGPPTGELAAFEFRYNHCIAGSDDVVGPEGMEKFCEDIGVEPENVVMLVLAWKLDAQNMGYFTLQEWLKGMVSAVICLLSSILAFCDGFNCGQYAGVDTLKSRFLPWLGSSLFITSSGVTTDTSLNLIQESMEKEKKIRALSDSHEQEMQKVEKQLSAAHLQLDTIKQELADADLELNDTRNRSATTLLASEDEILQLKADLRASRDQADMYKRKLDVLDDFERQMRMLKDEVSYLTAEKSLLQDRITRSRSSSPLPRHSRSPSPLPFLRSDSPTRAQLTNSSRHSRLVTRFTDIYANERLDTQNLLSRYIDNLEMVQRIIFISTVESFHAAKMAFRQFKLRVRKTLSPTHTGQASLDDTVLDYIVRNLDLYDVQSSVNRALLSVVWILPTVNQDHGGYQHRLADADLELNDTRNRSATTLLASEDEILQLKADLRASRDQADMYKRKLDVLDDFERQMRMLKDEVSYLTAEKSLLQDRITRSRSSSPLPRHSRSPSPLPFLRSDSPTRAQLTNSSRHSRLVTRFTDIYANERLDTQNLLSRYIDNLEMVQRIIFISTVESFHTAKMAFRQFKLRVRKTLSPTHTGQASLDDTMLDYIVRNLDLYDVQSSVNDVIRAMNVNPKISFPPEIDFIMISSFIREMCRLAFAMQTLEPPLDLAFTTDGELYSESKYRRSYDSEFTAPLVAYHVWPALMEGDNVIVKGEAFTKRGALVFAE
ncbi:UNVERIFIED_CONTAM: hypothetical protein FKN15_031920 [Acipenser sinensis]